MGTQGRNNIKKLKQSDIKKKEEKKHVVDVKIDALPIGLQNDLIELWEIQSNIQNLTQGKTFYLVPGTEKILKGFYEKVRQIIDRYGPDSYSINAGLPPSGGITLTWNNKKAGTGEPETKPELKTVPVVHPNGTDLS